MDVAITGATGHVGANLSRALLERGDRLRVLVRQDTRAIEGLDVERLEGDVLDRDSLVRLVDGVEVVYHLAAEISIERRFDRARWAVNVTGPRNMVSSCLECGVRRLVHFSSIHALADHPLDEPIDEMRALAEDPRYLPYSRSKAAGEREIQAGIEKGLDAVIVNPTGVIGPHDYKPSLMGEGIQDLCLARMPGLVRGGYDWVDARDVAKAAMAAEVSGRKGERYLLSGHWIPFSDMAELIKEFSGVNPPRFVSPMWLARLGAPFVSAWAKFVGKRPRYTGGSLEILRGNRIMLHDKATRELGHNPRPLRETLEATIDWLREVGRLPPG